jgi:hypothetical protein
VDRGGDVNNGIHERCLDTSQIPQIRPRCETMGDVLRDKTVVKVGPGHSSVQTLPLVNSMRPVLRMAAVEWLTGLPLFNAVSKMFLNLTAAGNIFFELRKHLVCLRGRERCKKDGFGIQQNVHDPRPH